MTRSTIALAFGALGLVAGLTFSNMTSTSAAAGTSARWQYKGGVNPAW